MALVASAIEFKPNDIALLLLARDSLPKVMQADPDANEFKPIAMEEYPDATELRPKVMLFCPDANEFKPIAMEELPTAFELYPIDKDAKLVAQLFIPRAILSLPIA